MVFVHVSLYDPQGSNVGEAFLGVRHVYAGTVGAESSRSCVQAMTYFAVPPIVIHVCMEEIHLCTLIFSRLSMMQNNINIHYNNGFINSRCYIETNFNRDQCMQAAHIIIIDQIQSYDSAFSRIHYYNPNIDNVVLTK